MPFSLEKEPRQHHTLGTAAQFIQQKPIQRKSAGRQSLVLSPTFKQQSSQEKPPQVFKASYFSLEQFLQGNNSLTAAQKWTWLSVSPYTPVPQKSYEI